MNLRKFKKKIKQEKRLKDSRKVMRMFYLQLVLQEALISLGKNAIVSYSQNIQIPALKTPSGRFLG